MLNAAVLTVLETFNKTYIVTYTVNTAYTQQCTMSLKIPDHLTHGGNFVYS